MPLPGVRQRPPRRTLFPYTTLFRSLERVRARRTPVQSWYLDVTLLSAYYGSERVYHHTADRKSTRLNSSHLGISYAVFCLKKKTSGAPQDRDVINKRSSQHATSRDN